MLCGTREQQTPIVTSILSGPKAQPRDSGYPPMRRLAHAVNC
jgi:hypothetical protein